MKLLFVTTVYPTKKEPFRGVYIQNRAKALIKEGINVKVAFFCEKDSDVILDSFSKPFTYKETKKRFFKKTVDVDETYNRFLMNYEPDLVIFFIVSIGLEKKIMSLNRNIKYSKFFEGRNIYYEYKSTLPRIIQYFSYLKRKSIIKKMSFIFFCSKLLERDFDISKYKNPKFKTITLTNGFDQNIFKPIKYPKVFDKEVFKIIAVGNLIETKGFVTLVEAVSDVFNDCPKKVQLTIVGSGNKQSDIKNIKTPLNVRLKMIDQLSQIDLLAEIRKHDYFILPSVYESFGCVYLEAMSQGLITVGCLNQGPSVFIKDGINGFLVSDIDKSSLRKLLYNVKNEKINLEQISKNAVADSKQYSWESFAKKFVDKVIL